MSARRAAAALSTVAVLAAATPAAAFVRSTTGDPNLSNPPPDPTKGVCLAWAGKQVTFKVNATGYVGNCGSTQPAAVAAAADLVRQSVKAWMAPLGPSCSDFQYLDGGDTTQAALANDGENRILIRKGSCSDTALVSATDPCHGSEGACAAKFDCWEHGAAGDLTIALTTATYQVSDGTIVDADMELFSWGGQNQGSSLPTGAPGNNGWYFTCGVSGSAPLCQRFGDPGCLFIDLGHTVTHEAGHMLGLDHPCVYSNLPASTCFQSAIMAATATPGDTRRTLTQDDANGVCAIYPTGKAVDKTTGCFATGSSGSAGGGGGSSNGSGCGTGGGGLLALLGVLPLALRRRARQDTIAPA